MKVLLTKSVPHLGLPGDVKEVADGYARNFLIPQQMAVLTSDPLAKKIASELSGARAEAEASKAQAEASVAKWEKKKVKLTVKANPDGTLFGAVTAKDIAEELGVEPKQIHFDSMKVTGEFEAVLDLGHGVTVDIPVIIEAEGKTRSNK
jgi:large subunit ribosomal protein L9